MKLDDLKVWVSPITNKIYVGTVGKDGTAKQKRDVTKEVIATVMQHLDQQKPITYTCEAGELTFTKRSS